MTRISLAPGPSPTPLATVNVLSGLRRWRAALGDALYARAPICVFGDSLVFGQGADGINTPLDVPDNTDGWVGQLRQHGAALYGDAGEGAIIVSTNASYSLRVTANGGTSSTSTGVLGKGTKLVNGQSFTVTVPQGCTSVGIVQGNLTGDVNALYALDGAGAVSVGATLTGADVPIETEIPVSPNTGHTIVISGPATAEAYVPLVTFRRGTAGVPVHRLGIPGTIVGDLLGGQTSGALTGDANAQSRVVRAGFQWSAATSGLAIISFGSNDYQFQGGGGTSAQNNETPALYSAWLQQAITTITALNWCVLLLFPPRTPSTPSPDLGYSEDAYAGAAAALAASNDHVAFFDLGAVWGPTAHAHSADMALQLANSVHPTRRGHGDIARIVAGIVFGGVNYPDTVAP